jgi:hypothetical protein
MGTADGLRARCGYGAILGLLLLAACNQPPGKGKPGAQGSAAQTAKPLASARPARPAGLGTLLPPPALNAEPLPSATKTVQPQRFVLRLGGAFLLVAPALELAEAERRLRAAGSVVAIKNGNVHATFRDPGSKEPTTFVFRYDDKVLSKIEIMSKSMAACGTGSDLERWLGTFQKPQRNNPSSSRASYRYGGFVFVRSSTKPYRMRIAMPAKQFKPDKTQPPRALDVRESQVLVRPRLQPHQDALNHGFEGFIGPAAPAILILHREEKNKRLVFGGQVLEEIRPLHYRSLALPIFSTRGEGSHGVAFLNLDGDPAYEFVVVVSELDDQGQLVMANAAFDYRDGAFVRLPHIEKKIRDLRSIAAIRSTLQPQAEKTARPSSSASSPTRAPASKASAGPSK